MFDVPGLHVLDVGVDEQQRVVLTVESDQVEQGCPGCGVLAVGHGRRCRVLHDAPCLGRVTVLRWLSRVWRCREPACVTMTFTERHQVAPPRAVLTVRAVRWAVDALRHDDTTVSSLARHLGVACHTAWQRSRPRQGWGRQAGTTHGGEDPRRGRAHLATQPARCRPDADGHVDLTRDHDGCLHARLLDAVIGGSGTAYKRWLQAQPDGFTATVEQAALDPFCGYANAIRDELPDAVAVLDGFHVVRLGTQVVDEVRRRVQQDTKGIEAQTRPALPGPRHSAARRRAPHRTPAGQDHPPPGSWRPKRRSEPGLAVLPAPRSIYHASTATGCRPPNRSSPSTPPASPTAAPKPST
jgi:transposase